MPRSGRRPRERFDLDVAAPHALSADDEIDAVELVPGVVCPDEFGGFSKAAPRGW